jgi:integrin-linked kinase-associated serine/threonine phosphatase 2C
MELHEGVSFFGVFDGHAGAEAARFVASRLKIKVLAKVELGQLSSAALVEAALETDQELLEAEKENPDCEWGGTTAVFTVITPDDSGNHTFKATVGNIGDSRCLLMYARLNLLEGAIALAIEFVIVTE